MLPAFDALVTDYSSVAYDFSLIGAPIVYLAPDVETYAKTRGLYEAYRDFSGGRHVATWQHVLALLDERRVRRCERGEPLVPARRGRGCSSPNR